MNMKRILKKSCGKLYDYVNEIDEDAHTFIIRFKGDVDKDTIPCIKFHLKDSNVEYVSKNIIANFKDVTNVDTATLAVICDMLSRLKDTGHQFGVVHVSQLFCDHIQLLSLQDQVKVFKTEEEALKIFSQKHN